MRIISLAACAGLLALAPAAAQTPPRPDPKIAAEVQACVPDGKVLLERLVSIDSGTGDAEGLAKVGDIYAAELTRLGGQVRKVPSADPATPGDNLVATFTGRGRGRILLISHMDTVFSRGTVAQRPPRWVGERLIAPGAGDDKSGGVTAICALRALKAAGFDGYARIDLLINASEETGSPGSRDLIRQMAEAADAVINLERGVPRDRVLMQRKGSAVLTYQVKGRAAHSGLEPEKGRNAAVEAARLTLETGKLGDPAKQTTVNVTILTGGDKINVIPEAAQLSADVRALSAAEFDRVEASARRLASSPSVPEVATTSNLKRNFPPWPHAKSTDELLLRANRLYAELGRSLEGVEVGSSADSAFAALSGKPTIDGFGMEGDGAHGVDDYADFTTLAPRAYLLARMLMDLGTNPPAR